MSQSDYVQVSFRLLKSDHRRLQMLSSREGKFQQEVLQKIVAHGLDRLLDPNPHEKTVILTTLAAVIKTKLLLEIFVAASGNGEVIASANEGLGQWLERHSIADMELGVDMPASSRGMELSL